MQFSIIFCSGLALAGSTIAKPVLRTQSAPLESGVQGFSEDPESCIPVNYNLDINNTTCTSTNITSTSLKISPAYSNKDRIPYQELPACHVKCWDSEAYKAMWVHDVRKLSIEDFCWKKRVWTESWMIDHLMECVLSACKGCGWTCGKASQEWMHKYCHRP
ncbi:hypothetical protein F5Y19DRAFT_121771 [Xylariaceae sp. FL1651]|nr:hypothetical protein F5Y19DRAFT_121771 [Xylariaceae sp. FL1651]